MLRTFLKDYIASLLTPTPLIGALLILSLFFLIKKKNRYALITQSVALALFLTFANNLIPDMLLNKYEGQQNVYNSNHDQKSIDYIVVLAGGVYNGSKHPLSSRLTSATLTRLVEGISILQNYPKAKLVVTGKGWVPKTTEAAMMKKMAVILGVSPLRIITEEKSKNTKDHPKYLSPILKDKGFILVTSALHMPRAVLNFRKENLIPVQTAAADHILKGDYQNWFKNFRLYPIGENLFASDRFFFELWGLLYTKIKY